MLKAERHMRRTKQDRKALMYEYGSRVTENGKSIIVPVRTRSCMDVSVFNSEEYDRMFRSAISSVRKLGEGWRSTIERHYWWARKEHENGIDPMLYELREKILSFGGDAVCMSVYKNDAEALMTCGQVWPGYGAVMMPGEACRCHKNSFTLAAEKGYRLCTGYALSDDGMWREHSWCVNRNGETVEIIETTEPRVLYFGYALTDEDTENFSDMIW